MFRNFRFHGTERFYNRIVPCEGKKLPVFKGRCFLSRLYPRSLKKLQVHTKPVYTKVSWLEGNFPAGLPTQRMKYQTPDSGRLRQNLPSYSYGLAEDSEPAVPHLASFEIYAFFIALLRECCQGVLDLSTLLNLS